MAKMTEEHKAALAKGRRQARAVKNYLNALEQDGRSKGRLDEDALKERIERLDAEIEDEEGPAKRVELIQKRLDYEQRLEALADSPDMDELESEFVDAVKEYSERKGISYMAWREAGVPAAVLRDAGMPRSSKPPS
ncbi:MAG: hypothetical protein R3343_14490 [Nitriliruptorales bacterium]|nr:hypothetical protein [Nitriliruptorales bacterium]